MAVDTLRPSARHPCHARQHRGSRRRGAACPHRAGGHRRSGRLGLGRSGLYRPTSGRCRHGIALDVVRLPPAKRGFVLRPRRWVVERSFAWATRFRRLVKDDGRYAQTIAGLHIVAFSCIMIKTGYRPRRWFKTVSRKRSLVHNGHLRLLTLSLGARHLPRHVVYGHLEQPFTPQPLERLKFAGHFQNRRRLLKDGCLRP